MSRPVEWVGSSKVDLKRFPEPVQDRMGFAIYQAQTGLQHHDAKPLKGFGSGVLEVVARHDGDTFRAVYTVRFQAAVYVLTRLPEEGEAGHRHAEEGSRSGPAAAESRRASLPGHAWRRVEP